jgi:hypothetical protein
VKAVITLPMRKELFIAAGLLITYAYAKGVEELCAQEGLLSDDTKERLKSKMEVHCSKILTLATPPAARPAPKLLAFRN